MLLSYCFAKHLNVIEGIIKLKKLKGMKAN